MAKKLNLVLRDPVKLHKDKENSNSLPDPFSKNDSDVNKKEKEKDEPKVEETKEFKSKSKKKFQKETQVDLREDMSPRVRQVWEYFIKKASEDEKLKNSFAVTRAEVMEEAGIGSTNTYRNALKKFEEMKLLKIEHRPGVTEGSLFHLTKLGLDQADVMIGE